MILSKQELTAILVETQKLCGLYDSFTHKQAIGLTAIDRNHCAIAGRQLQEGKDFTEITIANWPILLVKIKDRQAAVASSLRYYISTNQWPQEHLRGATQLLRELEAES